MTGAFFQAKQQDFPLTVRRLALAGGLAILSYLTAAAVVQHLVVGLLPTAALIGMCGAFFLYTHQTLLYWVLVVTAPFNDHLAIPLGPVNLRPYALLTLMVFGQFAWQARIKLSWYLQRFLRENSFLLPLGMSICLLKILTVVLATKIAPGMPRYYSLKFVIFSSLLFGIAFAYTMVTDTFRKLLQTIRFWIHLSNGVAILAIIQIVLSNTIGAHYVHHRDVIFFGRPYSIFREPDVLGSFMVGTLFIIAPMLVVYVPRFLNRTYLTVTAGLHGFMALILLVRAAWLGGIFAGGLMFGMLTMMGKGRLLAEMVIQGIVSFILFLIVVAVTVPSAIAGIADRFGSIGADTGESAKEYRMNELNAMFDNVFPPNPYNGDMVSLLMGHGDFSWSHWAPLLLGELYDQDAKKNARDGQVLEHPGFCMMLTIIHDNGVAGLTCQIIFFGVLYTRFFGAMRDRRSTNARLLLGSCFLPIMVVILCFQFSYDPVSPFLWVQVGMYLSMLLHTSRHQKIPYQSIAGI